MSNSLERCWSPERWATARHWYTVSYNEAYLMHKKGFEVRQHKKGHWQVLCTWKDFNG